MASTAGSNSRPSRASAVKSEPKIVKLAESAVDSSVSSTQQGKPSQRREVLIRQPSYCKILDDLKGTEAKVANMKQETVESTIEVTESDESGDAGLATQQVQTITINGQQYQIVSPVGVDGVQTVVAASTSSGNSPSPNSSGVVQYAASTQNGQTVFIPGTVATASTSVSPQIISVASAASSGVVQVEEAARKREIRLLKNREAARECRNKKKEYIKCLENRVGTSFVYE